MLYVTGAGAFVAGRPRRGSRRAVSGRKLNRSEQPARSSAPLGDRDPSMRASGGVGPWWSGSGSARPSGRRGRAPPGRNGGNARGGLPDRTHRSWWSRRGDRSPERSGSGSGRRDGRESGLRTGRRARAEGRSTVPSARLDPPRSWARIARRRYLEARSIGTDGLRRCTPPDSVPPPERKSRDRPLSGTLNGPVGRSAPGRGRRGGRGGAHK